MKRERKKKPSKLFCVLQHVRITCDELPPVSMFEIFNICVSLHVSVISSKKEKTGSSIMSVIWFKRKAEMEQLCPLGIAYEIYTTPPPPVLLYNTRTSKMQSRTVTPVYVP